MPDCQIAPLDELRVEVTLQIGAVKCQPRCERSQKVKSGKVVDAKTSSLGVTRLYPAKILNLKYVMGTKTDLRF